MLDTHCTRAPRATPLACALLGLTVTAAAPGGTAFVDDDATAGGDGASWATAFPFLQDALAAAADPLNGIDEVRVAGGVYHPDRDEASPAGTSDRLATFTLVDAVTVRGGYAGPGAADPDLWDPGLHETVLSGDLAGNDGPDFAGNGENSLHVVTGSGTSATAVLEGFTITAGNATAPGSSPDLFGGGLLLRAAGSPTVLGCTFAGSTAEFGGAVFNDSGGSPSFTGCTFIGNVGRQQAGGIYSDTTGTPSLVGCVFLGNESLGVAGGFYVRLNATLVNCVFSGNHAATNGGGLYSIVGFPVVTNCTFSANTAGAGGGYYAAFGGTLGSTLLTNCNLWSNSPDQITDPNELTTVTYSNVQGGWPGAGHDNMSANPMFVNELGPDGMAGTGDENLNLTFGSTSIDTGDNAAVPAGVVTDLEGKSRFLDGNLDGDADVDMGALEFEISVACTGDGGPFVATAGELFSTAITGFDADDDPLTVTSVGVPAAATLAPLSGDSPLAVTFDWTPVAADKPGAPYTIEVTFTDPTDEAATCSFTIEDINLPPVCDAGSPITVECDGPHGAMVMLDGTGSTDADDPVLLYHWDVSNLDVVLDDPGSATPSGVFPIGVTMATLTVADGRGGVDVCDVVVTVQDTMPPDVMCTTSTADLWPPNGSLRDVDVVVVATDLCVDPSMITPIMVTVRSDEPDTGGDVNGQDGFTSPVDVTGAFTFDPALGNEGAWVATIALRATRTAGGDGRAYVIDVMAFDTSDPPNVAVTSCVAVVPHDRRGGGGGGGGGS